MILFSTSDTPGAAQAAHWASALSPGAHTAAENHPTAASLYCDSPRIKQGIALKGAFNFILYILRFDRWLDRDLITKPYYSHQ